jgi:GNAT superfamily N-acetyltransferase
VIVRACRQQDVAELERHAPTGPNRYHEARYRRQSAGCGTFLIAFLDEVLVGSAEVMWCGPKEPAVRDRFPDCPEINGLAVVHQHRSQGIGTTIVHAAEELAAQRGHHRIGLGVDDQNPRAAALYRRLGYQDAGCRYLDRYDHIDQHGIRHEIADPCIFLIKAISAAH